MAEIYREPEAVRDFLRNFKLVDKVPLDFNPVKSPALPKKSICIRYIRKWFIDFFMFPIFLCVTIVALPALVFFTVYLLLDNEEILFFSGNGEAENTILLSNSLMWISVYFLILKALIPGVPYILSLISYSNRLNWILNGEIRLLSFYKRGHIWYGISFVVSFLTAVIYAYQNDLEATDMNILILSCQILPVTFLMRWGFKGIYFVLGCLCASNAALASPFYGLNVVYISHMGTFFLVLYALFVNNCYAGYIMSFFVLLLYILPKMCWFYTGERGFIATSLLSLIPFGKKAYSFNNILAEDYTLGIHLRRVDYIRQRRIMKKDIGLQVAIYSCAFPFPLFGRGVLADIGTEMQENIVVLIPGLNMSFPGASFDFILDYIEGLQYEYPSVVGTLRCLGPCLFGPFALVLCGIPQLFNLRNLSCVSRECGDYGLRHIRSYPLYFIPMQDNRKVYALNMIDEANSVFIFVDDSGVSNSFGDLRVLIKDVSKKKLQNEKVLVMILGYFQTGDALTAFYRVLFSLLCDLGNASNNYGFDLQLDWLHVRLIHHYSPAMARCLCKEPENKVVSAYNPDQFRAPEISFASKNASLEVQNRVGDVLHFESENDCYRSFFTFCSNVLESDSEGCIVGLAYGGIKVSDWMRSLIPDSFEKVFIFDKHVVDTAVSTYFY